MSYDTRYETVRGDQVVTKPMSQWNEDVKQLREDLGAVEQDVEGFFNKAVEIVEANEQADDFPIDDEPESVPLPYRIERFADDRLICNDAIRLYKGDWVMGEYLTMSDVEKVILKDQETAVQQETDQELMDECPELDGWAEAKRLAKELDKLNAHHKAIVEPLHSAIEYWRGEVERLDAELAEAKEAS